MFSIDDSYKCYLQKIAMDVIYTEDSYMLSTEDSYQCSQKQKIECNLLKIAINVIY